MTRSEYVYYSRLVRTPTSETLKSGCSKVLLQFGTKNSITLRFKIK